MSLMIKICIALASLLILLGYILNKKSYDFEKLSQYECGIEPFDENITTGEGETREKFYLKFYIIGIIFLIFDLESLLLYPIVFSPAFTFLQNVDSLNMNINWVSYYVFLIFMFMLILGLIYEYKKKVLN